MSGLALAVVLASLIDPVVVRSSGAAQAGAETIAYGQSVLGQITGSARVAFYFLRAERGDVVSITMRRVSGNLDPHLDFATAEGGILASNDDDPQAEGTLNAAIRDFMIPKTDVYLIQATSYGNTEGSFTLAVAQVPPEELGQTVDRALLIDYGMSVESTLTQDFPTRYFRFYAEAGDLLTVTVRSEDIAPTAAILSGDLAELALSGGGTEQALIAAFSAPASGVYTLRVGAAEDTIDEEGAQLAVTLSGRAAPHTGQTLQIAYGEVASGMITSENPVEEYVFEGSAGDIVQVRMERVSGDLDALVTIYDHTRKQIAFDDDGAGESKDSLIDGFTLPYDGLYVLAASRYQRGQGQTSGAYILRLEQIGSGE